MLGNRTLISFCQILALQPKKDLCVLLEKHSITHEPENAD
jgi:hypothetical protein